MTREGRRIIHVATSSLIETAAAAGAVITSIATAGRWLTRRIGKLLDAIVRRNLNVHLAPIKQDVAELRGEVQGILAIVERRRTSEPRSPDRRRDQGHGRYPN